jgi:hypothetical protein
VQLAGALDVDRVGAVDHDLGDLGIVDELLQGAETENDVADLAADLLLLLCRERDLFLVEELSKARMHQLLELGLVDRGVVEPGAEDLDETGLDPVSYLGHPIRGTAAGESLR